MIFLDFLKWYCVDFPIEIFGVWNNFFGLFLRVFAIRFHVKTLFSPWHGVVVFYDSPSRIQNFFYNHASRFIGRILGAFVRSLFVTIGIACIVFWTAALPVFALFWISAPLIIFFFLHTDLYEFLPPFFSSKPVFALEIFLLLLIGALFLKARQEQKGIDGSGLAAFVRKRLGFDYTDAKLLEENDISQDDLDNLKEWFLLHKRIKRARHQFWTKEYLERVPPIGMDWASGYTPFLDTFSLEQKKEAIPLDQDIFLIGYKAHIQTAQQTLSSAAESNVLFVGEESAGAEFILRGLEALIESGRCLPALAYKRFIWLDAQNLLSGITSPGLLRERISAVFKEAKEAGNIVIGIERLHSLLDPAFPEIAELLIPLLQSEYAQIVATTTPRFFSNVFASHQGFTSLFHAIEVKEPTRADTFIILDEVALYLEKRFNVFITYQSVRKIIDEVDAIFAGTRPQKDIAALSEAVSFILSQGKKVLQPQDVLAFFSSSTGIPLGAIETGEREKLLSLEDTLHKRVIGQKEAIIAVAKALRRARTNVRPHARPIGNFLFLGPTGVGKTSVAKALAEALFGSSNAMIRFDMSEFQELGDIKRLIGFESDGTFQGGLLTEAIKRHPFSLLLLDEIEKAHPNILNLFLPMLDEATLTDGAGNKVNFQNVIIIATSNAGSEFIRTNIARVGDSVFSQELLDVVQKANIFRPEFLNRFDAVVAFKPLGKEELIQIAAIMLQDLAAQLKREHNITFLVNDDEKKFLATKGFTQEYGARPMARVLQDTIESSIADKILRGDLKKGDSIEFKASDLAAS